MSKRRSFVAEDHVDEKKPKVEVKDEEVPTSPFLYNFFYQNITKKDEDSDEEVMFVEEVAPSFSQKQKKVKVEEPEVLIIEKLELPKQKVEVKEEKKVLKFSPSVSSARIGRNVEELPPFTQSYVLRNHARIGDSSMSIVGYVEERDPLKKVRSRSSGKMVDILKFVVDNDDGTRVHCLAWHDEAREFERKIFPNQIVHFDMLRVNRNSDHNKGNVDYELMINGKSSFKSYGFFRSTVDMERLSLSDFADLPRARGAIKIEGYLRGDFTRVARMRDNRMYNVLTDKTSKIELTVINCIEPLDLKGGQKVCVVGEICVSERRTVSLRVKDPAHIRALDSPAVSVATLHKDFHYAVISTL